jgi:hypothetical protein
MLFIADKYKEKGLTLDELFHHYDRLIVKKNINFERQSHFLNEELSLKNYKNQNNTLDKKTLNNIGENYLNLTKKNFLQLILKNILK